MMKQAKAGKPIDIDAVPPPVASRAAQPSAPASSQPDPPSAAPEGLGISNKAEKHEQATQDGISKSLQDSKLCM